MTEESRKAGTSRPSGITLALELLVIFLLVALIPTLVCMGVHRSAWNNILEREILKRNYQVANTVAFELHQSLETTRKILETTARYPDVRKQDREILSSVLSTLYQIHNTIFAALYVIDAHGNQLVNVTNQPEAFSDVSSAVWYRNVVQGTYSNYTSMPFISKATGNPSITMAVLVRGKMYNVEAVLAAEVNLNNLWGMLKSITIGKSGYVYVVDNKGRIICHPDDEMVTAGNDLGRQGGDETGDPVYRTIMNVLNYNEAPHGSTRIRDAEEDLLVSCVPLSTFDELGAPPWTVMAVQSAEEMYTEERPAQLRWTAIILVIASSLMGLGAAGIVLRRLAPRGVSSE